MQKHCTVQYVSIFNVRFEKISWFCLLPTGLIKVIPEDEYVPVGSNYTVYCSINRSQSSDSSANLVWSKGYPPFTDWRPNPGPTPANETRIVNDTTVSITFFNMATTDTDYYFCYLKGTSRYQDTDHCDIHVIGKSLKCTVHLQ